MSWSFRLPPYLQSTAFLFSIVSFFCPEMNTNGEGKQDQRSTEAADLLEEFWFFRNLLLLQRKNTHTQLMKRCFSDPSSSSNNQEMISFKDPTDSPPKKLPQLTGAPAVKSTETKKSSDSSRVLLMRTPSLPPCCLEKDDDVVEEEQRGSRSQSRLTKHNSYKVLVVFTLREEKINTSYFKFV